MFSDDQGKISTSAILLPWLITAAALPVIGLFYRPILLWGSLSAGIYIAACAVFLALSSNADPSRVRVLALVALLVSAGAAGLVESAIVGTALEHVQENVPLSDDARSLRILSASRARGPALDDMVKRLRRDRFLRSNLSPHMLRQSALSYYQSLEPDELVPWFEAVNAHGPSRASLALLGRLNDDCSTAETCLRWSRERRRALAALEAELGEEVIELRRIAWDEDLASWTELWESRAQDVSHEEVALQSDWLAVLYQSALDGRDAARLDAAHARLSWMLPRLRGFGYSADLLYALRRQASSEFYELWLGVNTRSLIPLSEAYHDQEDFAAIERMVAVARSTSQGGLFDSYASLVSSARQRSGTLHVRSSDGSPLPCELRIDGRAVEASSGPWRLLPGSHTLECLSEGGGLFASDWQVQSGSERTWLVDLDALE